jgi:serine/threonine protein kinase
MAHLPQDTPRAGETTTRRSQDLAAGFQIGVRNGYFTPLDFVAKGGMGLLFKVQLHREEFVIPYVTSHVLSGDLSPALVGIHGKYQLDDPEFEDEVRRRISGIDRRSLAFQRMLAELERREQRLVRAGYVAAIKVPSDRDASLTSRFFREVRILHNLGDHPHLVKYISCDLLQGGLALIMEYFPSDDLAEVLATTKLTTEQSLRIFVAALEALHHAHRKGVIHRDVKPANILVAGDEIKVTDFGLAKPLTPELERTQLTMAEQMVGTPSYMAPEQIDPAMGDVGEWTDVYQLGVTLFEMLTQRPLYDEREYRERSGRASRGRSKDTDPRKQILAEVGDPARRHPHFPRDFDPTIPDEVEKLVMTLCQKDLLERYTCELALEHAREILGHRLFVHAEPFKPPSEDRKSEKRTTLILSASEAMLAKRAYEEAEAYAKALSLVTEAEREQDVVARADHLEKAAQSLERLPQAKFPDLHARLEALMRELESERDDIDAFRPNRKIALEIAEGFEGLSSAVEGDHFYEASESEVARKAEALRARAEQHLERIRRTGLPDRIVGIYRTRLEYLLGELPGLAPALAARRAAFIGKKREELAAAADSNPAEAALIYLTLRRALEGGDPDEKSRALLVELEARYGALVAAEPPA